MIQVVTSTVTGVGGIEIPYSLMQHETTSSQLAILLPGFRYSTDAPMFHFSTSLLLERSVDVLEINYEYYREQYDEIEDIDEIVRKDVATVVDHVLSNHTYEQFYLIGKSLGTIAMVTELKRPIFQDAFAIWLTPLIQRDDVRETIVSSETPRLVVIGDRDHCYTESRYKEISDVPLLTSVLLPDVNHSLEREHDTLGSLAVLTQVIDAINRFLPDNATDDD